ncbi:hypothetical protein SLE2022_396450 [Rubroshorea leprosula]
MTSSLAAVRNPLLILLTSFFLLAAAQQGFRNVSVGDVLHADDQNLTWQSPSGDFEFGFCRVPDQQDRFLLAIWFAQIPNKTIVWSANGDNPVEIKSNVELTSNGLVLRAPSGMELWRSNSTQNGTEGVSHAAMLDTGNFVITGMNSDNIWESFQNPTDTILPGQELGVDSILSSAISRTSYKKGRFQLRFTSGYLVLNQIDVVTGKPFQFYLNITDGSSLIFNESGYILIRKSSGSLVELAPNNTVPKQDSYYRATLGFDGVFTLYSYSKTSYGGASWASTWYIPEDICSSFVNPDPRGSGPCGYNSICQPNQDGRATCRCPDGFSVLNAKNPLFGCRPNYQSKPEDCNEEGSTIGEDRFEFNTMQFVDWPFGDYELLQSVNEIEYRTSCIVDCLCAVAILQPPERNNGTGRCWKKKLPLSNGWFNQEKIDRKVFIKVLKSGELYRNYVAVKKLEKVIREWEKEFKTEVNVIGHTHHRNLVRLFGYCDEDENRLLVSELMQNGSVASFLFGVLRPSWKQRLQIATGIARGLTYLHEECSTQIIHCDIKPQNILLDDSFTAKISDFGLAKLLINSKSHTLTGIRGTKGYVAPEWFRSTPITVKVDVYSFGVMLLEIFCCRRYVELEMDEAAILTEWPYDCYSEGNLGKLVENDEEAINDIGRVEMLVKVAMWCVQDEPSQWPKMRTVTMMLEGALLVPAPLCPFLYSFKPKDSSIINPEFP